MFDENTCVERELREVRKLYGGNGLPLPAPRLFGRPVGKRVDMAARFVQVKLKLQYLVLDVLGRGTWCVEVNDVARHQRPRELIESTGYLLQRVEGGEVEGFSQTNRVIPGVHLEPPLLPRFPRGILDLVTPFHAYPKVRVGLDRAAGCSKYALSTDREGGGRIAEVIT